MYFEDLSPYQYGGTEPEPTILNVGWLSIDHAFARGAVSGHFMDALERLVMNPVHLYRGSHICEFCPPPPVTLSRFGTLMTESPPGTRGNGEIRVPNQSGDIYVAPALIAHYVAVHDYLPPKAFVDAVIQIDGRRINWCLPWQAAESAEKSKRLQWQLLTELREFHPLATVHARVIGHRMDNGDIAVMLHDGRYAVVHLTWGQWWLQPEEFPLWRAYDTLHDFQHMLDKDAIT